MNIQYYAENSDRVHNHERHIIRMSNTLDLDRRVNHTKHDIQNTSWPLTRHDLGYITRQPTPPRISHADPLQWAATTERGRCSGDHDGDEAVRMPEE